MAAQVFQAWVLQKKRPACETSINAAFKPLKRDFGLVKTDIESRRIGIPGART
jgi:hypothetical protein